MTDVQLTIDGREVPAAAAGHFRRLSPGQAAILRHARANGGRITSAEAGKIIHAGRNDLCSRREGPRCCKWCSSDGWSAMTRLRERGMFWNVKRGLWELVS